MNGSSPDEPVMATGSDTEEKESEEGEREEEDLHITLRIRSEAFAALKQYENQLLSAAIADVEDMEDGSGPVQPIPELLDETKTILRDNLFSALRHIFLDAKATTGKFSSTFYESVVYSHVSDRIRRNLGYYQALQRAEEEIKRNNNEIGDSKALEMELTEIQKTLSGLDEVDFVRGLGTSLGVSPLDLDEIVKYVIVREFAPLRRREKAQADE